MTGDELSAGERYYDYILTHVNDLVLAIHRTEQVTQYIRKIYQLKKDEKSGLPYGPPDIYLEPQIYSHQEPEYCADSFCCTIFGEHYVKNMVTNAQKKLMDHGRELNSKQQLTFVSGYRPGIDM